MSKNYDIQYITQHLEELSIYQISSIKKIITQLRHEKYFWLNKKSTLINQKILDNFGDALRIHHVFSAESLSKDRFEYALERVMLDCGVSAHRAPKGNPGHDLTIGNQKFSLKTQADKNIKENIIHISKFMELGKGEWTDKIEDIERLRSLFIDHLSRYQKIITLRRLRDLHSELYELVEIPKALLEHAQNGQIEIMTRSTQIPKPGYCTVYTTGRTVAFRLYFDGGSERKLQVKDLQKNLCFVHAIWRFPRQQADNIPVFEDDPIL